MSSLSRRSSIGAAGVFFVILAAAGCDEMQGVMTTLFGTVTLDGEEFSGVTVESESGTTGDTLTIVTSLDGSFGFIVEPGPYTVRLIDGLPDGASCEEGTEQQAVVPDGGTTMLTFTCETNVVAPN